MSIDIYGHYPELLPFDEEIKSIIQTIVLSVRNGGKLLLCGNGGSAADCEHISGELLKGFLTKRPMPNKYEKEFRCAYDNNADEYVKHLQMGIPAIPLTSLSALITAYSNDCLPELVFAQGVFSLGRRGDVLIALSTSGNSRNVLHALKVARVVGLKTVLLTGGDGGACAEYADFSVTAPSSDTYRVQEYHLPIYHYICAEVEKEIFNNKI